MKEARNNAPEKKYTPEQLADAEKLAKTLAELPQDRQSTVTMMANAFIAGMEAQARLASAQT